MAASFSPCCTYYATSLTDKGPVLAESDLILLHDNIFQHYFTCYLKPWSHWAEFIYSWQETKSSVSIPLNSVISYVKGTHLLWELWFVSQLGCSVMRVSDYLRGTLCSWWFTGGWCQQFASSKSSRKKQVCTVWSHYNCAICALFFLLWLLFVLLLVGIPGFLPDTPQVLWT